MGCLDSCVSTTCPSTTVYYLLKCSDQCLLDDCQSVTAPSSEKCLDCLETCAPARCSTTISVKMNYCTVWSKPKTLSYVLTVNMERIVLITGVFRNAKLAYSTFFLPWSDVPAGQHLKRYLTVWFEMFIIIAKFVFVGLFVSLEWLLSANIVKDWINDHW